MSAEFSFLDEALARLAEKNNHQFSFQKAPGQYDPVYFITFRAGSTVQDGNWGELRLGVRLDCRRMSDEEVMERIQETFETVVGNMRRPGW